MKKGRKEEFPGTSQKPKSFGLGITYGQKEE